MIVFAFIGQLIDDLAILEDEEVAAETAASSHLSL